MILGISKILSLINKSCIRPVHRLMYSLIPDPAFQAILEVNTDTGIGIATSFSTQMLTTITNELMNRINGGGIMRQCFNLKLHI